MSYPKDLEEYTDEELELEIRRRQELRSKGLCSYCSKPFDTENKCAHHEQQIGMYGQYIIVIVK